MQDLTFHRLHDLVPQKIELFIIRAVKLRRMNWARHVARMGEKRNAIRRFGGKARRK
jgi:hypothetical protein